MAIVGDDLAMGLRVLSIVVNGECFESGCNQISKLKVDWCLTISPLA